MPTDANTASAYTVAELWNAYRSLHNQSADKMREMREFREDYGYGYDLSPRWAKMERELAALDNAAMRAYDAARAAADR